MVQSKNKILGSAKKKRISIRIKPDGSSATMSYNIGSGDPVTLDEVENALRDEGIIHGLKYDEIKNAVETNPSTVSLMCAEWTPPKRGQDSDIDFLISEDRERMIDRTSSIDYHEIEYFKEVEEGQSIARKILATEGNPGISVRGESVKPEPGVDHDLTRHIGGEGVRISHIDENLLVAARTGIYVRIGKKVDVQDKLVISGNLNFKYGNVKTSVDVVIYGDVVSGFKLESAKKITILGVVENSEVHAGGDLRIEKGLVKGKAPVSAGGKLTARYITERLNIRASEVEVANNITNSRIIADRFVKAGRLTGGRVIAGSYIEINDLGNISSTATSVELGVNADLLEKMKELSREAELLKHKRQKNREAFYDAKSKYVETSLRLEEMLFKTSKRISPQILSRLEQTIVNTASLARKHTRMLDDCEALLNDTLNEISEIAPEISYPDPTLIVKGVVYPNVTIKMGLVSSYRTKGEMGRIRFVLNESGQIVIESLS